VTNISNFDWKRGSPMNNCHYYKQKRDAIYFSTCVLGLSQRDKSLDGRNLLDLVSPNFDGTNINNAKY
jgi:hypothetical protein